MYRKISVAIDRFGHALHRDASPVFNGRVTTLLSVLATNLVYTLLMKREEEAYTILSVRNVTLRDDPSCLGF